MEITELENIKKALENHGIIAFPTETVYGLGVLFDDFEAYTNLNIAKNRPEDKPYTMMLGRVEDINKYAYVDSKARKIIKAFMPGPITILLKSKSCVPGYVTHNTGIIGIRVPGMPEICEMINYIGKPLLVPSANKSGENPSKSSVEVSEIFKNDISYLIHGTSGCQKPSTLVDLTVDDFKVYREGPISKVQIEHALEGDNAMVISIGSDHAGFDAKVEVIEFLKNAGFEVADCGTYSKDSCDYPLFGRDAALKVANKEADFGILICSSGEGIMIAANKIPGIRCGIGYNDDVARLMREHNNANMIAFGASFMTVEEIKARILIFLNTEFSNIPRHIRRVDLIEEK